MKKCPLFPTNPTHSRNKTPKSQDLEKILKQNFGYSRFRGNQLEAIQAVLSGRDCFCLMPTGGGKSMCYQIPALVRPGIVLVVSPLIALMENQVAALKERGIRAEFLSSTQLASVKQKINEDLDCGKPLVKLLYVTPELMATAGFKSKLGKIHARGLLSLVAIDEAHCISSWGHDFRPSYRKLSSIRDQLSDVPLLALTATAAPKVQNDVIESLGLQDPLVLKASFNRPNIFYEVRYKDLLDNTYLDVSKLIKSSESACSIIYCLERSACDELCAFLTKNGISCAAYHAGLNNITRSAVLDDWLSSKIQVVVATVAFGMGIDRKDVCIVCHFNVPKSMEAFYQESGRAGRDQVPSRSILYYGLSDRKRMEFILSKTATAKKLQKSSSLDSLSRKSFADFSQIVEYCEGSGCRRKTILKSFGEQVPASLCQKTCDACKDPNMVATYLGQLEISRNVCQNYDACAINFKSSSCMAQHGETEFWNREDETEMLDEDISESDDGSETVDTSVVMTKIPRTSLKQKIDLLQRAEETYYQKTDPKKQGDANVKKVVPETLREASKQRLLNSLKKAQERFGKLFINLEESSRSLEMECFKKYGKVGRTFYNSQIASTIRWLSSSCYKDISDRLSSGDANSVAPESPLVSPMTDTSVERLSSSRYKHVDSPYSSDAKLAAPESQLTSPTRDTLLGNHDTKNGADDSLRKDDFPPIPSFSEFVNKKEEGTFCQRKDLANPNLSSRTGSSKGAHKRFKSARR